MNGSDGMGSEESDESGSEWEYEETYVLTGSIIVSLVIGVVESQPPEVEGFGRTVRYPESKFELKSYQS